MDNQVLALLLDIQKDIQELKTQVHLLHDDIKDGFLTLELANDQTSNTTSKLTVRIMKLEKRIFELMNND